LQTEASIQNARSEPHVEGTTHTDQLLLRSFEFIVPVEEVALFR